jgi:hypothetical protein
MPEQIHSIERRTTLEGFDFPEFMPSIVAEEQRPRSKAQIIALLRDEGESWAKWLKANPTTFSRSVSNSRSDMTPPTKTRFKMLLGTKEHEMHHRGQLMLFERMLGIVPHLTRHMQERMAMASTVPAREAPIGGSPLSALRSVGSPPPLMRDRFASQVSRLLRPRLVPRRCRHSA